MSDDDKVIEEESNLIVAYSEHVLIALTSSDYNDEVLNRIINISVYPLLIVTKNLIGIITFDGIVTIDTIKNSGKDEKRAKVAFNKISEEDILRIKNNSIEVDEGFSSQYLKPAVAELKRRGFPHITTFTIIFALGLDSTLNLVKGDFVKALEINYLGMEKMSLYMLTKSSRQRIIDEFANN